MWSKRREARTAAMEPGYNWSRRPLPLRRNLVWASIGTVVYNLCQWGVLVSLARLGTATEVGRFSLGLAISAPIMLFANMQLGDVVTTDVKDEYRFADYLGLRLVTTILALATIVIVVVVAQLPAVTAAVVLVVSVMKAFDSASDLVFALLRKHERNDRVAAGLIANGVVSLLLVVVALAAAGTAFWGAVATCAGSVIVLLAVNLPNARAALGPDTRRLSIRIRFDRRTLARLARLSLPLGVMILLISLNLNIPRYVIEHELGTRELGIFSALAYVSVAGATVIPAMAQAASPRLAQLYATGDTVALRALMWKLVGFAAALGSLGVALAVVVGRPFLQLLYGPDYAAEVDTFRWIIVGAALGLVASFLNYAAIAVRRFRSITVVYGIVIVTTMACCVVLVPRYGLVGAAVAALAGIVIQVIGCTVVVVPAMRSNRG